MKANEVKLEDLLIGTLQSPGGDDAIGRLWVLQFE
jgi:hypothetical protein